MVTIDPDTIYCRAELVEALGSTILGYMTRVGGLRAVGDRYLGKSVLESFGRVHDVKGCQRVSGKEVNCENGSENRLGKATRRRGFQSASGKGGPDSLVSQILEVHG